MTDVDKSSERFCINPNYVLRRDGAVGTICEANHVDSTIPCQENILSHIHLFTAQLFSCFDGQRTLSEAAAAASKLLGVPVEACLKQVARYIENETFITNRIGEHWQIVPKNFLIPVREELKIRQYTPNTFVSDKYDFKPPDRLLSPLSLGLILTTQCLTDCVYCYARRPLPTDPIFGLDNIIDLIHQAVKAGVVTLDVNGGDVMLYPDWDVVVKELVLSGYDPLISTKKPLISEDIKKLVDCKVSKIQISIDSLSPSTCSDLLKVKGEQYLKGIKRTFSLLDEVGLTTQINSVITKRNATIKNMEELTNFLLDHSCIKKIMFTPAGYSLYKKPYSNFAPTIEQIERLQEYISKLEGVHPDVEFTMSGYETDPKEAHANNRFANRAYCTANTRNAVVLPDGRMTICEELYDHPAFIIGDLKKETLLEAWNSERALNLFHYPQQNIPRQSPCHQCSEYTECHIDHGVCWKTIIMAYGETNYLFPDPICPKAPTPQNIYWLESENRNELL